MDPSRFDALSRALAAGQSRRALTRLLSGGAVGGPLGLLGLAETTAKKKGKVTLCHQGQTKTVSKKAKKKYLKQGATLGACAPAAPPGPTGPTCSDGVRNGSETDVDCGGGTCRRCGITQSCLTRNDCASALCAGAPTTCQPCVNAGDCGTDAGPGTECACRDHESGQRFCTKNGPGDVRLLPAGTPCTACQGGEQCFPINGGANGIECIRPCGA